MGKKHNTDLFKQRFVSWYRVSHKISIQFKSLTDISIHIDYTMITDVYI